MTSPRVQERRPRYPSDSKDKKWEYQKRYYKNNPWARKYQSSLINAKKKNLEHRLTTADVKELWFRDEANKLHEPSIDRIDSTQGYYKENCRFIEQKENNARDNKGRKNSKAQTEAGRLNLLTYLSKKYGKSY